MKNIIRIVIIVGIILLIPLIAMRFTSEVDWDLFDFVIMGVLLFVTGVMLDLTIRRSGKYRIAAAIFIVLVFLYIWAELAVGVFTNLGS